MTDDMGAIFREELRDLLESLERGLLDLKKRPEEVGLINQVFRDLHTVKGSGAMFGFTDHVEFDLSGRRVALTAPVDLQALAGVATFNMRRVIRNGQLEAVAGAAWDTVTVTSVATYAVSSPNRLTAVANVANILPGSRVSGTGVGREVYVQSVNVANGTVELSQPLFAAAGTRTFTFQRYRYLIDMSGFENLSRIEFREVEFNCLGIASGIILPRVGIAIRVDSCFFNRPRDRGITSAGSGCQGLMVDGCQFISNEQDVVAQSRTTIAVNVNANDAKLRSNRVVRFAHFAILGGSGHLVIGNHFFQGDEQLAGLRRAGIVFTSRTQGSPAPSRSTSTRAAPEQPRAA